MSLWCLIPAAGKGTRMRPLTHSLPKAMLPVAGKPSIYHIIDKISGVGIKDFVIITGYLRQLMEAEIKDSYPDLNIHFVEQVEQKGLGHACLLGEEKIQADDSLMIIYGDTLFEADLKPILKSEFAQIGVYPVEDPRRFGVIEKDGEGNITSLVEKPEKPPSDLAIPGVNFFPSAGELFDAIHYILDHDITTKGEYQITDAFSHLIHEKGSTLKYFVIDDWYDCGTLESMLLTNQQILQKMKPHVERAQVESSEIIEPVYLARDVIVKNSKIGPHVSISQGSFVQGSSIKESIIDEKAQIEDTSLEESLIGRNVKLNRVHGKFILGDHCSLIG